MTQCKKKTIRDKSGKERTSCHQEPEINRLLQLRLNLLFPGSHSVRVCVGGRGLIEYSVALAFRSEIAHKYICRAEHFFFSTWGQPGRNLPHPDSRNVNREQFLWLFFFKQKDMKALFKWADLWEYSLKQWITLDGNSVKALL